MITVPEQVRRSVASRGAAGRSWLATLPRLVDELCHAWALRPGEVLDGGKWACVVRVSRADGSPAVLKVALPTPEFTRQLATITAADGCGYVRLYDADPERHALLMEALGQALSAAGRPVEAQLDLLAATLRQAWRVPRSATAAPTPVPGADKASALLGFLNEYRSADDDVPCSPDLLAFARALAARRAAAFDPSACVLCHGDPHADNALAVPSPRPGAESGYVFVDPDGFPGEPAYDLGVTMRGWTSRVLEADDPIALTRAWSTRLAEATGVDEQAVWEWALVERVTSGLYLLRHGHEREGRQFLASAERLVQRTP